MNTKNTKTKDVLLAVGGALAILGVYILIGSVNPMLLASDGFVECLDSFYK